jgi:hypothetical protein
MTRGGPTDAILHPVLSGRHLCRSQHRVPVRCHTDLRGSMSSWVNRWHLSTVPADTGLNSSSSSTSGCWPTFHWGKECTGSSRYHTVQRRTVNQKVMTLHQHCSRIQEMSSKGSRKSPCSRCTGQQGTFDNQWRQRCLNTPRSNRRCNCPSLYSTSIDQQCSLSSMMNRRSQWCCRTSQGGNRCRKRRQRWRQGSSLRSMSSTPKHRNRNCTARLDKHHK